MAKYATGKYAKAISDRSGLEFPYKEMVREWNGSLVNVSEFEPEVNITMIKAMMIKDGFGSYRFDDLYTAFRRITA